MIGDAPLSKYTSVPGWETEAEEEALISLARQYVPFHDGVIVEIGGEYARSAAQFAYAVQEHQNVRIVTVDLFPDDHHIAGQHGGLFAVWRQNLMEAGIQNYTNITLVPIRGDSGEIGNNWNTPIDVLFIDGDHSLNGVRRDISAWVHHVKAGGAVAFHDVWKDENSHYLHREVLQAIDEYFNHATQEWERHDAPDSLLYFVRKVETHKAVESSASTPGQPAKKPRKPRKVK